MKKSRHWDDYMTAGRVVRFTAGVIDSSGIHDTHRVIGYVEVLESFSLKEQRDLWASDTTSRPSMTERAESFLVFLQQQKLAGTQEDVEEVWLDQFDD